MQYNSVFQPMGRNTYLGGEAIVNSYNFMIPLLTNRTILVNYKQCFLVSVIIFNDTVAILA